MPVPVQRGGFPSPYAHLNKKATPLAVSKADLLRGIICVGRRPLAVQLAAQTQLAEIRGYDGLLDAYVDFDGNGPSLTNLFLNLDGSEKVGFTYRIGMGMALLLGQADLKTPWLIHLDDLSGTNIIRRIPPTQTRGDLLGLSTNSHWHAVEAKGNSNGVHRRQVQTAKRQVQSLPPVNGAPATTHTAALTDTSQSPFEATFVDPPPEENPDRQDSVEIQPDRFVGEYYQGLSFLTHLDFEAGQIEGIDRFEMASITLPGSRIRVGLPQPIYTLLDTRVDLNPLEMGGEIRNILPAQEWRAPQWRVEEGEDAGLHRYERGRRDRSLGLDGIYVEQPTPP